MKVDLLPQLPSVLTNLVDVEELEGAEAVIVDKRLQDDVDEAKPVDSIKFVILDITVVSLELVVSVELVVSASSPHIPKPLWQPVPQ